MRKENEARVQVDIGVQINPQDQEQTASSPPYWGYALAGLLILETLAMIHLLGWH